MGPPKSSTEATETSAKTAQRLCRNVECTIVGETSVFSVKKPTRQETRKYVENI